MKQKGFVGFVSFLCVLAFLLSACGDATEDPPSHQTASPAATSEEKSPETTSPQATNPVASEFTVTLNGSRASWDPVPGAVYYLCKIYTVENAERVDVIEYTIVSDWYGTTVHQTDLPRGYGVEVIPQDADRQEIPTGKQLISDVAGNPAYREPYRYPYDTPQVHPHYEIFWKDLTVLNLLERISPDSIVTREDGTVHFTVQTFDGKTVRFFGRDVEFKNGNLVIHPEGRIWSLDALGRVIACDIHTIGNFQSEYSITSYPMYTFTSKTSVESIDELYEGIPNANNSILAAQDYLRITGYETQGNFFSLGTMHAFDPDTATVEIDQLTVYYDTKTYTTALKKLEFNQSYTKHYVSGDFYDPTAESFDVSKGIFDFYLLFSVDDLDRVSTAYTAPNRPFDSDRQYTVGELRDKDGNVMNKHTDSLEPGATIDVTVGDYTLTAPLLVSPRVDDAKTQHDLVPFAYPEAKGKINALVVPLVWQDTPEVKTPETLDSIFQSLGRVIGTDGTVKDYTDGNADNGYSLSEYYDTASYGQLRITSFVTDWCHLPYRSGDNTFALSYERAAEIVDQIYTMYPKMDFSVFDRDKNGYFDSVIFINVPSVGTHTRNFYTPKGAGTAEKPGINCYTNLSAAGIDSKVFIHEFAHSLGLIDYYDVTSSGVDAVGKFDMQSQNAGDWNPYSKYSVGWITPEVITGLEKGENVEIEIGAFVDTGDAIVIPGAESHYNGTPFGEYILVDLFTDHGLNESDAEAYGLKDAVGVRLYHVNAVMEGRVLSRDGKEIPDEGGDERYPIGTPSKTNAYSEIGTYHLELIQAGGNNTFTDPNNLRTVLQKNDLFAAGDRFDAEEYTEFFHNGLLDDRTDFGYILEIVSIEKGDTPTAVIRITRK